MRVCCDWDDVTVNFVPGLLKYYNAVHGKSLKFEDVVSFKLWEIGIGTNLSEAIQIIQGFYESEFYDGMGFVEGARENLLRIMQDGELHFITARYGSLRGRTNNEARINFPNARVHFSRNYLEDGKSKGEIAKELGADVMIEDDVSTAMDCSRNGIATLLFDKPWNQEGNGLVRVRNWQEVMMQINKLNGVKND